MTEVDKILYKMGYYDSDPQKQEEVRGYINEAVEFMTDSGVPASKLTSQRSFAVKSIWADLRDKSEDDKIIQKDGMIVALISQMRR
ncbi:MAG: hypothetical protein RR348_05280 [Clostridia bacterium]